MVLCSQDSFTSCASLASPGLPSATFVSTAPSPTTPASAGPVGTLLLAPSPFDASAGPSPAGTPPPPGSGDEHMLPLQHLLMSERAQHLTALEVKAIVFKVCGCRVLCGDVLGPQALVMAGPRFHAI